MTAAEIDYLFAAASRARRWWALTARRAAGKRGPQWTGRDKAILSGDLTMAAWERAGQTVRGGRR